jgi:hypothetical protein
LLLLLLLLAHVAKAPATELPIRVVHAKRGLLWLNSVLWLHILLLLVAKLIEACGLLLLLLLEATITTVTILEACLLRLHSSRLRVGIVEESSVLWLLLVLIYEITEPVYLALLLVPLVVPGRLVCVGLRWRVTEEEIRVRLFELLSAQLLLFFAELDGFCEVVIVTSCGSGALPALLLFFRLVLAGL